MIPYAYIVAYESEPNDPDKKVYLAFVHVYVMAKDDDDAYYAGYQRMKALGMYPQHAYNDYVIPMGQM